VEYKLTTDSLRGATAGVDIVLQGPPARPISVHWWHRGAAPWRPLHVLPRQLRRHDIRLLAATQHDRHRRLVLLVDRLRIIRILYEFWFFFKFTNFYEF